MSFPTHMSTLFLLPGMEMGDPTFPEPVEEFEPSIKWDVAKGFDWLINDALSRWLYAPARESGKRVIQIDDVNVDEKGVLLEPIFAVTKIISIQTGHARHGWADQCMADGSYAELEYEIEAIYEIAKRHFDKMRYEDEESTKRYHHTSIDFIGLWSAVMGHGDWGYGSLPELDHFEFDGEGKVIPT